MNLVVTGGAGFVGSHVVHLALERGHNVTVIDDLSTGDRQNVPAGVRLVQADIRDHDAVARVFREVRPDAVSHQAAQASVSVSVRDPRGDADVNVLGSIVVLTCANEVGARVVFASTGGAIYGEVPEGSAASVDDPNVPLSPYGCAKAAFEIYLRAYAETTRTEHVSLRYANVYGPRQNPHGEAGVVAIFCERAFRGESLQVNAMQAKGDDGCIRDYVYVGDVAKANMAAIEGQLPCSTLNVGTGVGTSTRALAQCILSETKSTSALIDGDFRQGDLQRSVLNVEPFVELFGTPVSLQDGLKHTVEWYGAQSTSATSTDATERKIQPTNQETSF